MDITSFKHLRRRDLLLGSTALAITSTVTAQAAGEYPYRPIRIIVPYAPGGSTDAVGRLVAEKLGQALKQPVVIENKPGANGIIGSDLVARAAPDGYTLLFAAGSVLALSPLLYKANFDPVKSFAPVSMIASWSLLLIANSNVPASTLKDVIELARSGKRSMSIAAGTSGYSLMCEELKLLIGAPEIINVPYNGSGPQERAVLAGEADMMINTFNSLPLIRAGKLRALGVFSDKRSPTLPDVPTIKEQGVDMVTHGYGVLLAPAGTPPVIVQRLQTEIVKIVADPEVRDLFARLDYEPVGSTAEQLAAAMIADIARYRKMIKDTNFKLEK